MVVKKNHLNCVIPLKVDFFTAEAILVVDFFCITKPFVVGNLELMLTDHC